MNSSIIHFIAGDDRFYKQRTGKLYGLITGMHNVQFDNYRDLVCIYFACARLQGAQS